MIFVFDLDNTLYSPDTGLFRAVDERINLFLTEKMGFPSKVVNKVRTEYWLKYGTTLNGLMKLHKIDPIEYLEYVHDVDVKNFLKKDTELIQSLKKFSNRKIIFTNGYKPFAEKVLEALGVRDFFDCVFDIVWMNFAPKPHHFGYLKMLKELKVSPEKCCYFDDFHLNLVPAKELGMWTVLVKNFGHKFPYIDFVIDSLKTFYVDF